MARNTAEENDRAIEHQRIRTPDAFPGPDTRGHLREWGDDLILGCGPHKLPDGRNY